MRASDLLRAAALTASTLLAVCLPAALVAEEPASPQARPVAPADCRWCHVEACDRWERSAHALSTRPATSETVPLEVAAGARVEHPPGASKFLRRGTALAVETVGDDGRAAEVPLEIVVGVRRMTMLVGRLADGRLQVLPAMHEEPGGAWFDYTHLLFGPAREAPPVVRPGEPSYWTGPDRSFDVRCARCHMSGREALVPADGRGPRSVWRSHGVDCVACHGDGAAHVAHRKAPHPDPKTDPIPKAAHVPRDAALAVCLPCHLEGEVLDPRSASGDPLERIEPTLLDDVVRVDAAGRPVELMYEGLAFLTSTCATKGKLTCVTCHQVHGAASFSLRVDPSRDHELCASCHADLVADAPGHSHHAAGRSGARCTACHMGPVAVERGHGVVRDHSIGVPRPAPPDEQGARDACTWCHDGGRGAPADAPRLDGKRLGEAYAAWWPGARVRPWWSSVIERGRRAEEGASRDLVALAQDVGAPRLVRASAVRLLREFPEEAERALIPLVSDRDPVLRRSALFALSSSRTPAADAALAKALADPSPGVRFVAARSALAGWERVRASKTLLAAVLPVLAEDAAAMPEDHLRWFRLGAARQIAGDVPGAIEAYERKLLLDPGARAVRETVERLRRR